MSGIRLPLLCAFAGGCLSNALLFGLWHVSPAAGDSAARPPHAARSSAELVAAGNVAPNDVPPPQLAAVTAADHAHDSTSEAAPAALPSALDSAGPTPAGSAVSDVLTSLEAAYRERVAASVNAPAQPLPTQGNASEAAAAPSAVAAAEPAAPSAPTQPVAAVIPATSTVAPVAQGPQVAAAVPATLAPQLAAVPAVQDAPPPVEIHYGDVNQNTYVTNNVREGDVYQIQLQQVAVLQYMQALGMSGLAAPARHVAGAGHQRGVLSSGITNPDNPWGFHFAPLNLVR